MLSIKSYVNVKCKVKNYQISMSHALKKPAVFTRWTYIGKIKRKYTAVVEKSEI